MRSIQIMLGLGLVGLWLVLGAGPLGEPRPEMKEGRDCAWGAGFIPATPKAEAADAACRQAAPALGAQPGVASNYPSETRAATIRERGGPPPRLPDRIADLVQRQNLERVVEKYARHYGVDQDLVWAVIRQESGFNVQAVSPKGARGLMQLMPGTAAMLGVTDAFDVEQNVAGASSIWNAV